MIYYCLEKMANEYIKKENSLSIVSLKLEKLLSNLDIKF